MVHRLRHQNRYMLGRNMKLKQKPGAGELKLRVCCTTAWLTQKPLNIISILHLLKNLNACNIRLRAFIRVNALVKLAAPLKRSGATLMIILNSLYTLFKG